MNTYQLKRTLSAQLGLTRIRWTYLRPGVYVFNYHRIGDPSATPFDPNVFSSDELHFEQQVETIQSRFRLINLRELSARLAGNTPIVEPLALITFDDGYTDNYSRAFPILSRLKAPATFFVPTAYIETPTVPWWDEIAWLVKRSARSQAQWLGQELDLTGSKQLAIRRALNAFKANPLSIEHKLDAFRMALQCEMPQSEGTDLFMTWRQLCEMRDAGMDIGSHTHSHRILSHLSAQDQTAELTASRDLIQANLGGAPLAVAYPVGGKDTFTIETQELAARAGYKMGFSFISGLNRNLADNPFALRRMAVEENADAGEIRFISAYCGSKLKTPHALRRAAKLAKKFLPPARQTS